MGTFRKSNVVGQVVTSFSVDDAAITAAKLAAGSVVAAKLSLPIRNETGGSLAAGDLVYASGWSETQSKFLVSKADADAASKPATWIMQGALTNNTNGTAYKRHRLTGLNANSGTVGDPIYLSTTAGSWTQTQPTAANAKSQVVGYLAVKSATVGEIEFDLTASFGTDIVGTNELQAGAVDTTQLAASAVTLAKVSAATMDGTIAKVVANVNVIGGLPVLFRIKTPGGATADTDVVTTHKIRVIDVWCVNAAVGTASDTIQVKNGATAITDAIDVNDADKTVSRATTIDDAQWEIAAAGTLRVTETDGGGTDSPAVDVYVLAVRVA